MRNLILAFTGIFALSCGTIKHPIFIAYVDGETNRYCVQNADSMFNDDDMIYSGRCVGETKRRELRLLSNDVDTFREANGMPLEVYDIPRAYLRYFEKEIAYKERFTRKGYDLSGPLNLLRQGDRGKDLRLFLEIQVDVDQVFFVTCNGGCIGPFGNNSFFSLYKVDRKMEPVLIKQFDSAPYVFAGKSSNFVLLGVGRKSTDNLIPFSTIDYRLGQELINYEYIGLLNDSQSVVFARADKGLYVFDHLSGHLTRIFQFSKEHFLDSYVHFGNETNAIISRVPSSVTLRFIVLKGSIGGKFEKGKLRLFVLRQIGNSFKLYEHGFEQEVAEFYVSSNDDPLVLHDD